MFELKDSKDFLNSRISLNTREIKRVVVQLAFSAGFRALWDNDGDFDYCILCNDFGLRSGRLYTGSQVLEFIGCSAMPVRRALVPLGVGCHG